MVTMGINGFTYADVAASTPGSEIYTDIVRWADTIKARGSQTFFGFVHEPESSDSATSAPRPSTSPPTSTSSTSCAPRTCPTSATSGR